MTMLIFPDLEPVARLRSAIPESCHALLAPVAWDGAPAPQISQRARRLSLPWPSA